MNTGVRIQELRRIKKMTQGDLAAKIGTTPQNISQYERGVRKPKLETLRKIALALDTTVSELVCDDFWKNLSAEEQANAFDTNRASLLVAYDSMNETGKRKAVEQVEDLAKIPDYQKKPGGE